MANRWMANVVAVGTAILMLSACAEESGSVPEVPAEELEASVPELSAVHEFMQPLWHDAFPARDFALIQELVPQFEPTLAALDAAELPGILRDKQALWDGGKVALANTRREARRLSPASPRSAWTPAMMTWLSQLALGNR